LSSTGNKWAHKLARGVALSALVVGVAACGLPRVGPNKSEIFAGSVQKQGDAFIVSVDDRVARATALVPALGFSDAFIRAGSVGSDTIHAGDVLGVTVWENVEDGILATAGAPAGLEEVQVDGAGYIFIPYAGRIRAAGNSPEAIRRIITEKLESQTPDPQVQVRQFELNQMGIIEALRRAEIDVALSYDLAIPADLEFLPLRRLPPYAMVHEGHPLANRGSVTVQELKDDPMILLDLPLSADYFLEFFEASGRKPRIAERTRDMAVMRSLVANGFGYAIANIRPYSDLSPDGRKLRFIPLAGPVRQMELGLVLPRGACNVLTVSAFVDHARKTLDEWDYPGHPIDPGT